MPHWLHSLLHWLQWGTVPAWIAAVVSIWSAYKSRKSKQKSEAAELDARGTGRGVRRRVLLDAEDRNNGYFVPHQGLQLEAASALARRRGSELCEDVAYAIDVLAVGMSSRW